MATVSRPDNRRKPSPAKTAARIALPELEPLTPDRPTSPARLAPRHGTCALTVSINGAAYLARILPGEGADWPDTVRLTKADGTRYHVSSSPGQWVDCDCPSSQHNPGRPCKHVAALTALRLVAPVLEATAHV